MDLTPDNLDFLQIGNAVFVSILGIFIGFIAKLLLRKGIDSYFLKKVFKNPRTYETTAIINKVFTEVVQWLIIIGFINYSMKGLGFRFLEGVIQYGSLNSIPIFGFIAIVVMGILVSEFIMSKINAQDIENKEEIKTLTQLVILTAFILTALEFIGIKATAITELYKVILYIIGAIVVIFILNPKFLKGKKK